MRRWLNGYAEPAAPAGALVVPASLGGEAGLAGAVALAQDLAPL